MTGNVEVQITGKNSNLVDKAYLYYKDLNVKVSFEEWLYEQWKAKWVTHGWYSSESLVFESKTHMSLYMLKFS